MVFIDPTLIRQIILSPGCAFAAGILSCVVLIDYTGKLTDSLLEKKISGGRFLVRFAPIVLLAGTVMCFAIGAICRQLFYPCLRVPACGTVLPRNQRNIKRLTMDKVLRQVRCGRLFSTPSWAAIKPPPELSCLTSASRLSIRLRA